jgi:hypothetical protein
LPAAEATLMPKQTGIVEEIKLSRERGHVKLSPSGDYFQLYWDHDVDIIDPTEMVRRNWMIGLLQQAAVHHGEVDVEYTNDKDATVLVVFLKATPEKPPPAGMITRGSVKRVEITPEKGLVTIFGMSRPALGPQPPREQADHDLLIYTSEGAGLVHAEESHRRTRIVALLRQALAEGLSVSVTHADAPNAVIRRTTLHAKE